MQMADMQMQTGTVRKWTEKGYGFITPDGSDEDVFVHNTAFGGGSLAENEKVTFTVARDAAGKTRAENVQGQAIIPAPSGQAAMQKGGAALQKDMQLIGQSQVEGVVKEWHEDKGYGFIEPKGRGGSIFCHNTAFGGGQLTAGTIVTLNIVSDPRSGKPRAENVQVLETGGVQPAQPSAAGGGMMGGILGMAPGMPGGMPPGMPPGMGMPGMPGMQAQGSPEQQQHMMQLMMQMQMMQMMAAQQMQGQPGQPGGLMPQAGLAGAAGMQAAGMQAAGMPGLAQFGGMHGGAQ